MLKTKIIGFGIALAMGCMSNVAAVNLTTLVSCNGEGVGQVNILVRDSNQVLVPNVNQTDNNGFFVIPNAETYAHPFLFWFYAKNGSTCGAYSVLELTDTNGMVPLPYYPTDVPCSCSKLNQ